MQRTANDRSDLVVECTIPPRESGLFPYLPQTVFKLTRIECEAGNLWLDGNTVLLSLKVGVEEQLVAPVPLWEVVNATQGQELALPGTSPGTMITLKVGNPSDEPITLRLRLHGYEVR